MKRSESLLPQALAEKQFTHCTLGGRVAFYCLFYAKLIRTSMTSARMGGAYATFASSKSNNREVEGSRQPLATEDKLGTKLKSTAHFLFACNQLYINPKYMTTIGTLKVINKIIEKELACRFKLKTAKRKTCKGKGQAPRMQQKMSA